MSGQPGTNEKKESNWIYVWTGALALAVAWCGFASFLGLAGILVWPASCWNIEPITVDSGGATAGVATAGAAKAAAINAAVAWFGGVGAIYTFFYNQSKKQRQHNDQLRQQVIEEIARENRERDFEQAREKRERDLAEKARDQEKNFEAAREKRERDLAELQRIEAEFAAYAKDFAQPEPLARINAAIGLGELARKPDPRRVIDGPEPEEDKEHYKKITTFAGDNGEVLVEARPWPKTWETRKTETNYPYFMRAAHRLAAALHQWDVEAPRAQAIRVLREMGEWAKDEGTDEPLLHTLVNALAEANRTAWALIREQADGGWDRDVDDDRLYGEILVRLEEAKALLDQGQQPEERELQFLNAVKGLWATRQSLVESLQVISRPPNLAGLVGAHFAKDHRNLSLQNVRMWQSTLVACNIQAANCVGAHFSDVIFLYARFTGANLERAAFSRAVFHSANFERANCRGANFLRARCEGADFRGADCTEAFFRGANCTEAKFQGTRVFGATFESDSVVSGSSWDKADFQYYERDPYGFNTPTGEYDKDLWHQLNKLPLEDPLRIPPWEKPADAAENSSGEAGAEKEASAETHGDQPTPSDPESQPIDPDSTQKDDE